MDIFVYVGFGVLVFLFLIGAPLAIAFSVGSIIIMVYSMGFPVPNIAQLFFSTVNSYNLLAMPFFILAGNILLRSGGMVPLRDFMNATIGHLPGGLATATVVFAAFLGAVSGAATACLAIIGLVIIPILVDSGYERSFSSGLTVVASELGLLIPPSTFFILFGAYNRVSIPDLFLSGFGPGLLTTLLMCIVAVFISKRRGYKTQPRASWKRRFQTFLRVIPLLFMPIMVLGGIYTGIFSPTQAASVSVFYSILLGVFFYSDLTFQGFIESLVETCKICSMIYILWIGADLFGKMMGYVGVPQMISDWVMAMELSPLSFLLMVELVLLIMGCFFSSFPMVLIVLPLFIPSVHNLGIDPVFYGCLAIFCSLIGEITPPFGPQIWIAAPICNEKMGVMVRESLPFLGAMVVALLLTTLFPSISMYLVNLMR